MLIEIELGEPKPQRYRLDVHFEIPFRINRAWILWFDNEIEILREQNQFPQGGDFLQYLEQEFYEEIYAECVRVNNEQIRMGKKPNEAK